MQSKKFLSLFICWLFFSNAMKYLITQQIIFFSTKKPKKQNAFFFFFCFTYQCLLVIKQKFLINIRFFSLLGYSVVHSTTNKKVPGSIPVSANSSYTQYSQGNLNCSVSYWVLKLGVTTPHRNRFLWSRATKKGFKFLAIRLIPMLSLSNYLVTY